MKSIKSRDILWGLLALGAHTAWGTYPVLARYLQTISLVPTFALVSVGNAVVLVFLFFLIFPRLDWAVFRQPVLWAVAVTVVARSVTNVLAARYTLAIYVQVINLMVPFLVAVLSTTFFRERLPHFTLPAMLLSVLGALLMMGGQIGAAGVKLDLGAADWLGIALAGLSAVFLALYMIAIRRSFRYHIPGDAVFAVQIITLTGVMGISSLVLREDWGRWLQLKPLDWLVFAAFVLVALIFANYAQILSLKHLPAPAVSNLLPWRLVSALGAGALLLGERLTSAWQFLGAMIILATLFWYLYQQGEG